MRKAILLIFVPQIASAGIVAGLGLQWQNFSFRPQQEEDTLNYYGYGIHGLFGYSVINTVDLKLTASYTPSQVNEASVNGDIDLSSFGATVGFRAEDAAYFGVGYEKFIYNTSASNEHNDIVGRWSGLGPKISVAGFLPALKQTYWQLGLSLSTAQLEQSGMTDSPSRHIDVISLDMKYLFMGKK